VKRERAGSRSIDLRESRPNEKTSVGRGYGTSSESPKSSLSDELAKSKPVSVDSELASVSTGSGVTAGAGFGGCGFEFAALPLLLFFGAAAAFFGAAAGFGAAAAFGAAFFAAAFLAAFFGAAFLAAFFGAAFFGAAFFAPLPFVVFFADFFGAVFLAFFAAFFFFAAMTTVPPGALLGIDDPRLTNEATIPIARRDSTGFEVEPQKNAVARERVALSVALGARARGASSAPRRILSTST
jgi:hypothetical protein